MLTIRTVKELEGYIVITIKTINKKFKYIRSQKLDRKAAVTIQLTVCWKKKIRRLKIQDIRRLLMLKIEDSFRMAVDTSKWMWMLQNGH